MKRLAMAGLFVLLLAAIVKADGFMAASIEIREVGKSAPTVASPRQEALMMFDGSTVHVVLRTHFRAGPKEVVWIIPVPAAPSEVRPADEEIFRDLESETAPRFYRETYHHGPPFSCGCGAVADRDMMAVPAGVVVEAAGTAGIFDWTVLGATDAEKLAAWLDKNHYAVPLGAERVLNLYVKDGWHWLAVKVRPEVADKPTLAPHPIAYTYRADHLVYPLAISQLSADLENEIVLYILAKDRFAADNWPGIILSEIPVLRRQSSTSGTNYEAVLRRMTDERGGHLLVTEFGRDLDSVANRPLLAKITGRDPLREKSPPAFLTRLRAVMAPKAMDRDLVLRSAGTSEPVSNNRQVAGADPEKDTPRLAIMGAAVMGIFSARFLLVRPRRWSRLAGLVAAALSALALAAL